MITFQTDIERILQWILKLENELDQQDKTVSNDLKTIKEQFQNHEVERKQKRLIFMNLDSYSVFVFYLY